MKFHSTQRKGLLRRNELRASFAQNTEHSHHVYSIKQKFFNNYNNLIIKQINIS